MIGNNNNYGGSDECRDPPFNMDGVFDIQILWWCVGDAGIAQFWNIEVRNIWAGPPRIGARSIHAITKWTSYLE